MTIENNTTQQKNKRKENPLEIKAREFVRILDTDGKRKALEYLRGLPQEVRDYIKDTAPYSRDLKSAQCMA